MTALARYSDRELRHALWRAGDLRFLLHEGQLQMREAFRSSSAKIFVGHAARRWGKTRYALTGADELCRTKPRTRVLYATPTQRQTRRIVEPEMGKLLADCPQDARPEVNVQQLIYRYPNGSTIEMVGLEGANEDSHRGGEDDLIVVDEAGFVDNLEYTIESVLLPRTLMTGGRLLLISNSPRSPGHAFASKYIVQAIEQDAYLRQTIYDNPRLGPDEIEDALASVGGAHTTAAKREFLCEIVPEETLAIVPEFYVHEQFIVRESDVPRARDYYVAADFGFSDFTAIVLAYWDFARAKIVVEDEIVVRGKSGLDVCDLLKLKEASLWDLSVRDGDRADRNRPRLLRVADAPEQLLADLRKLGTSIIAARKDDAEAALNNLRMAIQRHDIEIHPRCKVTIAHLKYGIWKANRSTYERSEQYGHFDCIDALKYLVRHVDRTHNPYPDARLTGPDAYVAPRPVPTFMGRRRAG